MEILVDSLSVLWYNYLMIEVVMEGKTETTIVLKLTKEEAIWLKALVQNPLNENADPRDEPKEQQDMRYKFWKALEGIK